MLVLSGFSATWLSHPNPPTTPHPSRRPFEVRMSVEVPDVAISKSATRLGETTRVFFSPTARWRPLSKDQTEQAVKFRGVIRVCREANGRTGHTPSPRSESTSQWGSNASPYPRASWPPHNTTVVDSGLSRWPGGKAGDMTSLRECTDLGFRL